MATIPGKECGACNMCCKVLVIEELEKDAGPLCKHCINGKGCKIYKKRPDICREYECDWQLDRSLGPRLRPDRTGTILQEDPDSEQYQAVCDPDTPMQWRKSPLVFNVLVAKAKEGKVVVAKSGLRTWRIYEDGSWQPWS
ncbi:MAG: YkgJ family cysteine cluster protein [Beijerinckiaceae bacterium]